MVQAFVRGFTATDEEVWIFLQAQCRKKKASRALLSINAFEKRIFGGDRCSFCFVTVTFE